MRITTLVSTAIAALAAGPNLYAQSAATAAPPSACALAAEAGVGERTLTSGGRERTYRLFVPQSYDGRTSLPLVLDLHGSGGTAARQAATSRFEELAARENVLVATLQAAAEGNR